jgi:hypothetical protein
VLAVAIERDDGKAGPRIAPAFGGHHVLLDAIEAVLGAEESGRRRRGHLSRGERPVDRPGVPGERGAVGEETVELAGERLRSGEQAVEAGVDHGRHGECRR